MRTYRELFRPPEFAPLFGASCAKPGRDDIRGQALVLHANGLKAMQAVGATLAGLIDHGSRRELSASPPPAT